MSVRRAGTLALAVILAVLFSSCGTGQTEKVITILIRMMPAQERSFREEIIANFEKEHNCKVNVATFNNEWDIERLLKLETGKKKPEIALVKTPFEMTRVLALKGYMEKLDNVMDSLVVDQDLAEYNALATGLGYVEGVPYYLPRKLETRILFYRKSMVADALAKFDAHKARINSELKKQNGYGLPAGYELEENVDQWDLYDLYVVGSIWANEEYNGAKMGRIAHRGARYGGSALFLADRALQLGASKEDILRLNSDPMVSMYQWEKKFIDNGIYNPGMWQDPWKGSNIYNGIKDGKVFLAWFQQIDNFIVHGWPEDPSMPSYLPLADDMGLALIPKGVSFELDNAGVPKVEGSRSISTGGWWWGIPKTGPEKKLAYELARFITNRENQSRECSHFGMIPVRKDVLANVPEVFAEGWVGDVFHKSIEQIQANELTTVPLVEQYSQIGQNLVEAWYKLCVEDSGGGSSMEAIKKKLSGEYLAKQKQILGDAYPQ